MLHKSVFSSFFYSEPEWNSLRAIEPGQYPTKHRILPLRAITNMVRVGFEEKSVLHTVLIYTCLLLSQVFFSEAIRGQQQTSQTPKETMTNFPHQLRSPNSNNRHWNEAHNFKAGGHNFEPTTTRTSRPAFQRNSNQEEISARNQFNNEREEIFTNNERDAGKPLQSSNEYDQKLRQPYFKNGVNDHQKLIHAPPHSLRDDQIDSREFSDQNVNNYREGPFQKAVRPIHLFPDQYNLALEKHLKEKNGKPQNVEYRSHESTKPSAREEASQEHSHWYEGETSRPSRERNNHQEPLSVYQPSAKKQQAPRQSYIDEIPQRPSKANIGEVFKPDLPDIQIPSLRVAELDEFLQENLRDTLEKNLHKDYIPRERSPFNSESQRSNKSPYPQAQPSDASGKNFRDHSQHDFDSPSSRPLQRPFLKAVNDRNHPSDVEGMRQRAPQSEEDENPPPFSNEKILITHRNIHPGRFSNQQISDNNDNYRENLPLHRRPPSDYSNEQNPSSHRAIQNSGSSFTEPSTEGQRIKHHEKFNDLPKLPLGLSNENSPTSHLAIQDPSERFHQLRELQFDLMNGNIPPALQAIHSSREGFENLRELRTELSHQNEPVSHKTNQNPSNSFIKPSTDLRYPELSHRSPETHLKYPNENDPVDSQELIQRPRDSYARELPFNPNSDLRQSPREFSKQRGPSLHQKHNPLFTDSDLAEPHQQTGAPRDFSPVKTNPQSERYYPSEDIDDMHSRKQGNKPNGRMGKRFQVSDDQLQIQTPKTSQISSRLPTEQQRKFLKEHSTKRNSKGHALSPEENVRSVQLEVYVDDQKAPRNRTTSARTPSDNLIGMGSETEPDSEPSDEAEQLENDDVFSEEQHDGFLDMGAYTDKKGSFGWYADFPVGRGHDKVSYSSS
ncbi:uncharacterized protein TNCT_56371 [Trichonephila clavata]|uniref:Uncharacterized protein n=1 Tax=Trichonephila clavata TaxID=2740835 RepID=A0A8X6EYQ5_TRICU|nr:uncharacterized protein TNCT_56371 [Trichonephila clavata]